jgi:hypothetical protein
VPLRACPHLKSLNGRADMEVMDVDERFRTIGDVSESLKWCLNVFFEQVRKPGVGFTLAVREYPWTKASILLAKLDDGAELPLWVCGSQEIARKCALHLSMALELQGVLTEGTTQRAADPESSLATGARREGPEGEGRSTPARPDTTGFWSDQVNATGLA